jgi:lysozyme
MTDPNLDQSRVWGLDVSHYQGTVSWTSVAHKGYKFAFIKATEGASSTDPEFSANWTGAKVAGLIRGAYHYYDPGSDPQQQAEHFLSTVWPNGLELGDLPPALDIETTGGQSAEEVVKGIQVWLSLVQQRTLRIPILYTNRGFWDGLATQQFGDYPLWVAEYGVAAPSLPAGWSKWDFWQFSQTGKVEVKVEVEGKETSKEVDVDLDVYQGSLESLQQMAALFSTPGL